MCSGVILSFLLQQVVRFLLMTWTFCLVEMKWIEMKAASYVFKDALETANITQ